MIGVDIIRTFLTERCGSRSYRPENIILCCSQMQLLRLVLSIMILEDQLVSQKASGLSGSSLSAVGKVKRKIEESRKKIASKRQAVDESSRRTVSRFNVLIAECVFF